MIFNKIYINPIIIQQKKFIDIFNRPNAYIEMNPSMFINSNGDVIILVRNINYRKFDDKSFVLYEPFSNSLYSIINCKIHDNKQLDLDNITVTDIKYNYNMPIYNTYWKGIEDIRFINSNTILVIIPECNTNGNPSIFRANIDVAEQRIHSFRPCMPNIVEKNWMPYIDNAGVDKVIYKLDPFTIKSVEANDMKIIDTSQEIKDILKFYNGSTNGINFNNYKLFLIHTNKDKTYHRWLLYNLFTNEIKISNMFVFFDYSYIEFPCSLCSFNERIFISIGVNDNKAFIIEINPIDITNSFRSE